MRAVMLSHCLPTVNTACSAVVHGMDLQTETHLTGTCSQVKKITSLSIHTVIPLAKVGQGKSVMKKTTQ